MLPLAWCHAAQHVKASERAHEDTSPAKTDVTSKSPVGDMSVVTLIRTDTTLQFAWTHVLLFIMISFFSMLLKNGSLAVGPRAHAPPVLVFLHSS